MAKSLNKSRESITVAEAEKLCVSMCYKLENCTLFSYIYGPVQRLAKQKHICELWSDLKQMNFINNNSNIYYCREQTAMKNSLIVKGDI